MIKSVNIPLTVLVEGIGHEAVFTLKSSANV